jgi:hypothetical protein
VQQLFRSTVRDGFSADWRGWLVLTWVIGWGWIYALMVVHARGPQVLAWLAARSSSH